MSSTSSKICEDICETIGDTPIVYLRRVAAGLPARVAVKLEYMNPSASVKDRAALAMLEDAEKKGLITPGKTVLVEATSGNLGVGLACAARVKGYKLIIVMPSKVSLERRVVMKAFGAELYLTDPSISGKAMVAYTEKLAASIPNSYLIAQFSNPANPDIHYRTTGPEIWRQSGGKVDIVTFGVGSAGTIVGIGRYLREQNPEVKVYAMEADESAVMNGECPGLHKIMGTGPGFVTDVMDFSVVEKEILRVKSDAAVAMTRRLALEEGILGGISTGGNVEAALQLARRPENAGKLIITCAPSFGERYLSTELYSTVKEEAEALQSKTLDEAIEAGRVFAAE